uniref:Cilia- and flagella-associated protein 20-like n=1 Tax=Piliocolobus tephrosceles TaxID=591936 RepID=A0A8C9GRU1_9PRIM
MRKNMHNIAMSIWKQHAICIISLRGRKRICITDSFLIKHISKPLEMWKMKTKKGCVRKVIDDALQLSAIEIVSENTSDSYIYTAPGKYSTLAISLPIIVLIVKNMNKFFSFRISIMDNTKSRRTFRISNFQTVTRLSNKWCTMPLVLDEGWNVIQINLKDYTEKAFKTKYIETMDIQINASIRIRCIYFCDRIYQNEELKDEFKIFFKKKEKIKYTPPQNITNPHKKIGLQNVISDKKKKKMVTEVDADKTNVNQPEPEEKRSTITNNKNINVVNETKGASNHVLTDITTGVTYNTTEGITSNEKHEYVDMMEELESYNENKDNIFENNTNDEEDVYLEKIIDLVDDGNKNVDSDELKDTMLQNDTYQEDIINDNNVTVVQDLKMDMDHIIYDEVNYEKYNNDDE